MVYDEDIYAAIARDANVLGIGSALITMVEPHPGHEHGYNRWYEDDHYYSDAMAGPWMFAGQRWVAPLTLRDARIPVRDSAVQPPNAGCYISTYFVQPGQELNQQRWSVVANGAVLAPAGRVFPHRDHCYTARHMYRFGILRDDGPMQPHHALDVGFAGLQVEIVDAPGVDALPALERALQAEILPMALQGSAAAMALAFTPIPFTQGIPAGATPPSIEGEGLRLCLLWFLETDPHRSGVAVTSHHAALGESGLGELRFSGCFVPTRVGTDHYVDQLR